MHPNIRQVTTAFPMPGFNWHVGSSSHHKAVEEMIAVHPVFDDISITFTFYKDNCRAAVHLGEQEFSTLGNVFDCIVFVKDQLLEIPRRLARWVYDSYIYLDHETDPQALSEFADDQNNLTVLVPALPDKTTYDIAGHVNHYLPGAAPVHLIGGLEQNMIALKVKIPVLPGEAEPVSQTPEPADQQSTPTCTL